MKAGIISDTHGLLRQEVSELLRGCDIILHGGDINRREILEELGKIAPVYAVRGNNDGEWAQDLPETRTLVFGGLRIFMIHNRKKIRGSVPDCDIVLFGHTHKYEEIREDGRLWLNPGSCGPRRFSLPVTMALMETQEEGGFTVRRIDLPGKALPAASPPCEKDMKELVCAVMRDTDRGKPVERIARDHGIDTALAGQICRLYLTHPGVDADGILNKMGL